jgi:hypothetical protein
LRTRCWNPARSRSTSLQDLTALFGRAGLTVELIDLAYLSRVMVLRKPA